MDFSNRQSAERWYKIAAAQQDPELRRLAIAAYKKYLKMAQREERQRLWLQNPGNGVLQIFAWSAVMALVVLAIILPLTKSFSVTVICTVFAFAFGLFAVSAAFSMRVYGHVSEKTMLSLFRMGRDTIPGLAKQSEPLEIRGEASPHPELLPPTEDPPGSTGSERK